MTKEFTPSQRIFLAKLLVTETVKQAADEAGIDDSTVRKWRIKNPVFKQAMEQVTETRVSKLEQAHTEALDAAISEIVALTPAAVGELKKIITTDWKELTDRRAASKLKAIESLLRFAGIEKQPSPRGRFISSERKLDIMQVLAIKEGDQEAEKQFNEELKESGFDLAKILEPKEGNDDN